MTISDCSIPVCLSSPFKSGVSMASRLCKAAMLSRFNLLAGEAKKEDVLEASTYHAAKVSPERNAVIIGMYFKTKIV